MHARINLHRIGEARHSGSEIKATLSPAPGVATAPACAALRVLVEADERFRISKCRSRFPECRVSSAAIKSTDCKARKARA